MGEKQANGEACGEVHGGKGGKNVKAKHFKGKRENSAKLREEIKGNQRNILSQTAEEMDGYSI